MINIDSDLYKGHDKVIHVNSYHCGNSKSTSIIAK